MLTQSQDCSQNLFAVVNMDPVSCFLYGLRSPESKRQWPKRFEVLFYFIGLHGEFKTKAQVFYEKAKDDIK